MFQILSLWSYSINSSQFPLLSTSSFSPQLPPWSSEHDSFPHSLTSTFQASLAPPGSLGVPGVQPSCLLHPLLSFTQCGEKRASTWHLCLRELSELSVDFVSGTLGLRSRTAESSPKAELEAALKHYREATSHNHKKKMSRIVAIICPSLYTCSLTCTKSWVILLRQLSGGPF